LFVRQEQQVEETEAPPVEFILMPINAVAKPVNKTFGSIDVNQFSLQYENEISRILHVPCSGAIKANSSDGGKSQGNANKNDSDTNASASMPSSTGGGMLDAMLFSKQMRNMNIEFEDMLSLIEIFCNSTHTKQKLDEHAKDSSNKKASHKKPRRTKHSSSNEAIAIQDVTEYNGKSFVDICANSISSIVACNQLYARSLIQSNTFLEYINQNLLSHGAKYSSNELTAVVANQIQQNEASKLAASAHTPSPHSRSHPADAPPHAAKSSHAPKAV